MRMKQKMNVWLYVLICVMTFTACGGGGGSGDSGDSSGGTSGDIAVDTPTPTTPTSPPDVAVPNDFVRVTQSESVDGEDDSPLVVAKDELLIYLNESASTVEIDAIWLSIKLK